MLYTHAAIILRPGIQAHTRYNVCLNVGVDRRTRYEGGICASVKLTEDSRKTGSGYRCSAVGALLVVLDRVSVHKKDPSHNTVNHTWTTRHPPSSIQKPYTRY